MDASGPRLYLLIEVPTCVRCVPPCRSRRAIGTTIGFARSAYRVNWTVLYDCTVPIATLSRAWAPERFVDGDGSVAI